MVDEDRSALVVIDVQNDFCTGGALAVPGSEKVVGAMNRYIDRATALGMPVYATRDWHPAVTGHFKMYGGQWPVHCVQGTPGARFHADLHLPADAFVITTGDRADSEGYSAFEGGTADGTPFMEHLRQRGITHLFVGGLATDYCVRHTVLAALAAGLKVTVLEDAISGVDVTPGDAERALEEMKQRGAMIAAGHEPIARHVTT